LQDYFSPKINPDSHSFPFILDIFFIFPFNYTLMKKVAVVLAGCGVLDGSEIYESVITLLTLDREGAKAVCLAPNIPQHHVVNHRTQEPTEGESRNVLTESARLARMEITDIAKIDINDLDAAIFPGGWGAAKNSCNYATKGPNYDVNPQIADFIKSMHAAGKPLGFLCISPMIAANVLGEKKVKLTVGNNADVARDLEAKGAQHVECALEDIVTDESLKVVSTPAYMLAENIAGLEPGITKLVKQVLQWTA